MKYLVLLGDGMSDYPIEELGGKTVLEHAKTPNMDYMARAGRLGLAHTVPPGMPPGSDVANLSVLGYDPAKYYTGRAPLEAASIDVELGPDDVAYRCNLVTLGREGQAAGKGGFCPGCVMKDFSAGHIPTSDAQGLIRDIDAAFGDHELRFYPGVSYRHLMVWKGGAWDVACTPPHDITGRVVDGYMPSGERSEFLVRLMKRAMDVLEVHDINKRLSVKGRPQANAIWLWGQGKRPQLPGFGEMYGLTGAMISAVDLMNGIAALIGFEVIKVPGATGYIDTDYKGKADAALDALERVDLVYVHVEAADESAHAGNIEHKIRAVEDFDDKVVGTVLEAWKDKAGLRVLLTPDHPTPISVKSHTSDPVPFVVWESGGRKPRAKGGYTEKAAEESGLVLEDGHRLMELLVKGG